MTGSDYLAETHEVTNTPPPLQDYNLYLQDTALKEALEREGAGWATEQLSQYGKLTGTAEMIEWGHLANRHKPEFNTHDRYGHRIDQVDFHPSYHQLMDRAISAGLPSSPWTHPKPGAHVARAALNYLQSQVEAGHGCPLTMTFAAVPSLLKQPDIAERWLPLIHSGRYDPSNRPVTEKQGATIGMAMTEKQGGSDVRANSTRAYAVDKSGPGECYQLVGHKYFVSAPMSDAFLMLAYTDKGLGCFLVPRWLDDGRKNALQILRLKEKSGNASNASSEAELRGAQGWLIGEEGRGVANILEMVALTRFDCMIGSAAGMRQASVQALHHCHHRSAFGKLLDQQPLMQNVLADLAIESEAAMVMAMRMARALDSNTERDALLIRLGTAVGKYWICKRTPGHAYEAMECIGGSGVMETTIMPRLYREAPVNAIWEGSGNVQALDMLRTLHKEPEALEVLRDEILQAKGLHETFDRFIAPLDKLFSRPEELEYRARHIIGQLALATQASLLLRADNELVADAFCRSRLATEGWLYGNLPSGINCQAIIERARPVS
ncbi:acyl-CoA dehydrogenase family protein [Aestuariirhabdus sp. Z084]|uniref:acyl-CoA dehydrogenase family protein n=1 Tax=Aestuariirhabdus haliotis TaxID=2918751 RepID=UPI00201B43A1|nr:acyl-CoA dehydrogenase family protein [Aestuariirhabdus haliotis]MCL6415348.1 acyl-CoA dehydrogenase family protein [Aestuariirhabdus haliotis]MCL6419104.1 acyl-CoA dehydrogenase family protein [Aestuariirhabdus haliotis]